MAKVFEKSNADRNVLANLKNAAASANMGVGLKRTHSAASAQSGASGQFLHKRVASQLNRAS